jgi:hypothetical protein
VPQRAWVLTIRPVLPDVVVGWVVPCVVELVEPAVDDVVVEVEEVCGAAVEVFL